MLCMCNKIFPIKTPQVKRLCVHLANQLGYIVIETMLQKYKSLEQAQTINQQLNTVNTATSKKEKI